MGRRVGSGVAAVPVVAISDRFGRPPRGAVSHPAQNVVRLGDAQVSHPRDFWSMLDLPTGTVTLLFTDIEGSTLLLRRLGERYGSVLSQQRAILRSCFARHGGHELGTEGDSFFVAFSRAADAVAACVAGQRDLGSADWPDGVLVRIRMGLHTGEPVPYDDGYMGMDVHRAARIASSGHGGQVVVSETTHNLVAADLAANVRFTDLGWHQLKDLPEPERIYQIAADGMLSEFPPLKSLGSGGNLPAPTTELIGREHEVAALSESLRSGVVRLLTLLGPGGVGKTRVAIATARRVATHFADGVYFVSLAASSDAFAIWHVLAEELRVRPDERGVEDAVGSYLSGRNVLLVLDNLEHLGGVGAPVATILNRAPKVAVLATSRLPLHVAGEHEHALAPLTLPPRGSSDPDVARASAAVQLFVQHARMVRAQFDVNAGNAAAVVEICRRLDGLPLAIELAAVRVKVLAPQAMLARLGSRLALGVGAAQRPVRQQTLRSTIGWSYDLLTPTLQGVLRRTGIFVGGCDLAMFEAIAGGDGVSNAPSEALDAIEALTSLADASLIVLAEMADGEPRVTMLETIHEYALEQLIASGEHAATARRHAQQVHEVLSAARDGLTGPLAMRSLAQFEAEHDNARAALEWALGTGPDSEPADAVLGLRLANAMTTFWYRHGHAGDGQRWFARAVSVATSAPGPELAHALHGYGIVLLQLGAVAEAESVLTRALTMWREVDDPSMVARELNSLSVARRNSGDPHGARVLLEESVDLSRRLGDQQRLATALSNLAVNLIDLGEPDKALRVLEECVSIDSARGDAWGLIVSKANTGAALIRLRRPQKAQEILCSVVVEASAMGDVELLAELLENLACIRGMVGQAHAAATLLGAAQHIREEESIPIPALDAATLEQQLAPALEDLGATGWEDAVADGRRLTRAEAIGLATSNL